MPTYAKTFNVHQVARLRGITPRTVERDIAAGRLVAVRSSGAQRVPASALETYRGGAIALGDRLTVRQVSELFGVSRRNVARAVRSGLFPSIRSGGRRFIVATLPCPALVALRIWLRLRDDRQQPYVSITDALSEIFDCDATESIARAFEAQR